MDRVHPVMSPHTSAAPSTRGAPEVTYPSPVLKVLRDVSARPAVMMCRGNPIWVIRSDDGWAVEVEVRRFAFLWADVVIQGQGCFTLGWRESREALRRRREAAVRLRAQLDDESAERFEEVSALAAAASQDLEE